jgi:chemotaxis protein methyltransferase CheR
MILREEFPQLTDWKFQLLGTDVSAEAVAKARQGFFTSYEVQRGLPQRLRSKYFRSAKGGWQLDEPIRRMVEFRQFNLCGEWPSLARQDIILARNVLVYFDLPVRQQILRKFRQVLWPDGYLLLGGAESAFHLDAAFSIVRSGGFSYYRVS